MEMLTRAAPGTTSVRATDGLLLLTWIASRALVLVLLLGTYSWVQGDLTYYAQGLDGLGRAGWSQTLVEYPVPGVLVLGVPWLFSGLLGAPGRYPELFMVMVLLIDAAFALVLRRVGGPRGTGVLVWLAAVPLLGVVGYARFDIVPGVLLGLAVLTVTHRPGRAGVWAGLMTAVKLWPALVLMVLAARTPRPVVIGIAVSGGLAVLVTLVLGGPSRLTSPLTYQSHRGLQVESVLASPAMLAWASKRHGYDVGYSVFHAYEVTGPGVSGLRVLSSVGTLLLAVGLVWLWSRVWRVGPALDAATIGWCCLATTSAYMVVGKVLSPQYLLWLVPVCAAVAVLPRGRSRALTVWSLVLCATAGLSQLVFPIRYADVLSHQPSSLFGVSVLVARNVLLVVLAVLAWRECLRRTASPDASPA